MPDSKRRPSGYVKPSGWTSTIVPRILRRDHYICYICKQPGANSVDHVIPVAEGGTHHDSNLAAIHRHPCHTAKTERERLAALKRRQRHRPVKRNPNIID